MSNKDFLSQFSDANKKPESFKQEERKPIYKERKPVNKVLIIVLSILALLIAIASYFIFFAPKIEMPNFVGKNKNDVAAWIKQQGIDVSGVVFDEDYYLEYDEGVIISQSMPEGKKVKENVKLNFVASKGADPSELIKVPSLIDMNKKEVQDWISENKLTKTKITTVYDDTVEEGYVIDYAFTGCEEDTFTRSSTLKINISKGVQPAGTVKVEDFKDKTYEYVESFAKTNKIILSKTEKYSDTVEKGNIISQSIEANKTMKQEEKLSVVVSKGKAITMIDLSGYIDTEAVEWFTDNSISYTTQTSYSNYSAGKIIDYSPVAGTIVNDEKVTIVVSLGKRVAIDVNVGMSEDNLLNVIHGLNKKGTDITTVESSNSLYSYDYKKGQVMSISCKTSNSEPCDLDNAPINAKIEYTVSKGKIYSLDFSVDNYSNEKYKVIKVCDELTSLGIDYTLTNTTGKDPVGETTCIVKVKDAQQKAAKFEIVEGNKVEVIVQAVE